MATKSHKLFSWKKSTCGRKWIAVTFFKYVYSESSGNIFLPTSIYPSTLHPYINLPTSTIPFSRAWLLYSILSFIIYYGKSQELFKVNIYSVGLKLHINDHQCRADIHSQKMIHTVFCHLYTYVWTLQCGYTNIFLLTVHKVTSPVCDKLGSQRRHLLR